MLCSHNILGKGLDAPRNKHEVITGLIGTGKGMELQYLDGQIAETIITYFMAVEISDRPLVGLPNRHPEASAQPVQ
ncbi:MAG: hypothetical protein VYA17_10890 [Pseudomonadota bacterium]|nr:hypothetical protein [Pseudomonadota bacterium]